MQVNRRDVLSKQMLDEVNPLQSAISMVAHDSCKMYGNIGAKHGSD